MTASGAIGHGLPIRQRRDPGRPAPCGSPSPRCRTT